jgi:hypothetical protein
VCLRRLWGCRNVVEEAVVRWPTATTSVYTGGHPDEDWVLDCSEKTEDVVWGDMHPVVPVMERVSQDWCQISRYLDSGSLCM